MWPGLSVQASGRYVNNVQQIVTELNCTASEDRVTVLNKIVISIFTMKQNGYWSSEGYFQILSIFHISSDCADTIQFLSFICKFLLADDQNCKHPESEIVQIQTVITQILYNEVLDTVIHRTFWLSDIISSDTIAADHVPFASSIFHPAITTVFSFLLNKLTDLKHVRRLGRELNHFESKFSL
jgi:hypothetical protein